MPKYTENWYDNNTELAVELGYGLVKDLEGSIVEIGSWEGKSSVHIANLVYPEKLICIDTWEGTPYETYEVEQYKQRDIESIFHDNIKHGTKNNVDSHKMSWQTFFASHPKIKIKFLYLDGPHGYDDVCDQINSLKLFIVKGGIMLGDDYHYFNSVKTAVNDCLGNSHQVSPHDIDTWQWINN